MTELETATIGELVDELFRRHEVGVVLLDHRDMTMQFRATGNPFWALGLITHAQDLLKTHETERADEIIGDEDEDDD